MKSKLKLTENNILEISNLTCTQAVKKLNEGSLNSQQMVVALSLRAGTVGQ